MCRPGLPISDADETPELSLRGAVGRAAGLASRVDADGDLRSIVRHFDDGGLPAISVGF